MLKVVNNPEGITIDSTLITIDSTLITIDARGQYLLKVPYRAPFNSNVKIELKRKITLKEYSYDVVATDIGGGLMTLEFYHDFGNDTMHEARIVDSNKRSLWRGKIFSTQQTDLQNYKIYE